MIRLPCCIDVYRDYAPKARYALSMLLKPLGVGPMWVGRSSLAGLSLYYGPHTQDLPKETIILPLGTGVEHYYRQRDSFHPGNICWKQLDAVRYPVLFGVEGQDDWVASAFYWLSGWQEYVTNERDMHGRFPHSASLQHALRTTTLPVVDIYRRCLQNHLKSGGLPTALRRWDGARWTLCPTIDVDYMRKWRKGIVYRELVEYFLLNAQRKRIQSRIQRLWENLRQMARRTDPFEAALDRMLTCIMRHGSGTIFLKAAAHGPRDVHYRLHSHQLRRLATLCRQDSLQIGLHPSYHAHTHPEYMRQERARLAELTGHLPNAVRQHYLRCEIPSTPRLQVDSGFSMDSTLGFPTHVGFRHGTCMPFKVFDVEANCAMDLWEFPLAIMDSALFRRQNLTSDEAIEQTKDVLSQCACYGGAGVVLWHNVLWDELDFPGWGHHFESVMRWGVASGARIMSLQEALKNWLGYPMGTQRA